MSEETDAGKSASAGTTPVDPSHPAPNQSPVSKPSASLRTCLYEQHLLAGAKMVDFSGWSMPVNYGSQLEEHESCRNDAVVFDVSHMAVLDLQGDESDATGFLKRVLANNVEKLQGIGAAQYTCLLNHQGGVLDDLIVYTRGSSGYRLIVNAGTREKDLQWLQSHLPPGLKITYRDDLALLAIQGPQARSRLAPVLTRHSALLDPLSLSRFRSVEAGDWFVGRTGYTGEDGVELALPKHEAIDFWQQLLAAGVKPAGLGARDTLRLEAGLNLYGNDMDEQVTPLESGIAWTVEWSPPERDFIGRAALEAQRAEDSHGPVNCLLGIVLSGRGIPRTGQQVLIDGQLVGMVTSGTFSPTLKKSIALVRFNRAAFDFKPAKQLCDIACDVLIRNKTVAAQIVSPPFLPG